MTTVEAQTHVRFILPESLHRQMKAKAAAKGMTIVDYMVELVRRDIDPMKSAK